jgi:hypothetical protein
VRPNAFAKRRAVLPSAAVLGLLNVVPPALAADPTVTAVVQEIASDYSWGYKTGLKQHLGSYKNGRSVHAVFRRTEKDKGNPDFLVWFDERTGEASTIEHPVGQMVRGVVNPAGNAVFTSDAPAEEQGRVWFVCGGRAGQLPFDLARSRGLFDPRAFDVVLDDFVTERSSTTPCLSVVGETGLLVFRYRHSRASDGAVRFQRYDLSSATPVLQAEHGLGAAGFVDDRLGDVTIEQLWSRWDPRRRALAVTWQWYFHKSPEPQRFGSNPFVYTEDLGETWLLADGSPAALPLTYATLEPKVAPYDHLRSRESSHWYPRDLGFGPKGTPWITLPVGNPSKSGASHVRFFFWGSSGWESRDLTGGMEASSDAQACGATRDYLVCAYSEFETPGQLLVRVSRDDGRSWSAPVVVDTVGEAPEGSRQRINWVSFVQPADRYLDNTARFFVGHYKESDGKEGRNYMNSLRWVRVQVGPRADFDGDQRVDDADRAAFETALEPGDGQADFNDAGAVDESDKVAFLAAWGEEESDGAR